MCDCSLVSFLSSRRRHTRCALVTGVQTCALPIAGIDTIEHASLIDAEGVRLAKEHGTWLAMDIFNTEYTQAEGARNGVMEDNLRKDREIAQLQRDNFRTAHEAGAKMVFATDAGVMPHGTAGGQFRVMTEYGMTPMEAIQAATRDRKSTRL